MALITEMVKNFFAPHNSDNSKKSSVVNPEQVLNNLSDDTGPNRFNDFFDYQSEVGTFADFNLDDIIAKQSSKINSYRQCAMQAEVANAIDIITNEIMFSYDGFPLKLKLNETNEKMQKTFEKAFEKIINLGKFNKNLFDFVRRSYIDGQMVVHCEFDAKSTHKGIKALRMMDPMGFYFDAEDQMWKYSKYSSNNQTMYFKDNTSKERYSPEEIARCDFGIWQDHLCLGYLEYAIKIANMLKCLEDLLVPLRFSRSISRRVFNVDIGDLPQQRGAEYMKDIQNAFKYKKFYNNETGEISNQQHITSMVEDYWFANRSGGKGTTVDLLDETGNLGELSDILYYNKKLYRALHIPTSHLDIDPDSDHSFSMEPTDTTQEDLKFMAFISRIRKVYSEFFKELLKREIISTGVMREREWKQKESDIEIIFTNENLFIERMKLAQLTNKIDMWNNIKDCGGTVLSFKQFMSQIFGFTDQEIQDNMKLIKIELADPAFRKLYEDAGFMFTDGTLDMMNVDIKDLDNIENGNRIMAKDMDDPSSDMYGGNEIENDPDLEKVKSFDGIIKALDVETDEPEEGEEGEDSKEK